MKDAHLFDAHCHLQDPKLYQHIATVLKQAQSSGVDCLVCCATTETDWPVVTKLADRYASIRCAVGIHPWFVTQLTPGWQMRLADRLTSQSGGIGEIGLDFFQPRQTHAKQVRVFNEQLTLARQYHRPVSIHCRKAWGALLECLASMRTLPAGAMIHAFGGSIEVANQAMRRGCYISVGGSVTRPNAIKLKQTVTRIPLDRLLIETDSPDILPHGAPPGPNVPANLRYVLNTLAELHQLPQHEIAQHTVANATALFGK